MLNLTGWIGRGWAGVDRQPRQQSPRSPIVEASVEATERAVDELTRGGFPQGVLKRAASLRKYTPLAVEAWLADEASFDEALAVQAVFDWINAHGGE